ncbi:MAG: hypothetical protein DME94_08525 [Verrucomicrobia bacterium]|nr:MAG: hypothetical protein DME94_08525 [Verrucomicrobiota bacterium]
MFPLYLRHLAERMFFAGYAKQEHPEENSNDALADERSHDALAQLSVSGAACKDESAMVAQASCLWGVRAWKATDPTGKMPVLLVIERRGHGVTITRGGPHR